MNNYLENRYNFIKDNLTTDQQLNLILELLDELEFVADQEHEKTLFNLPKIAEKAITRIALNYKMNFLKCGDRNER